MDTEKYHTGIKRFWAAIVDSIVFIPFLLVTHWLFSATSNENILISWIIFIRIAPLVYSVVLNYKYGQTIGKWVTGVKVMDREETRKISLKQSVLRDSFYIILLLGALTYFSVLAIQKDDVSYLIDEYAEFASYPVLI